MSSTSGIKTNKITQNVVIKPSQLNPHSPTSHLLADHPSIVAGESDGQRMRESISSIFSILFSNTQ
jgi:hypothetical protein